MSIAKSVRDAIPPINKAGYPFIAVFAAATLALSVVSISLFWIGVGPTFWCVLFFRDPKRVTPVDPSLVVSPADGRVCLVGERVPPAELQLPNEPMLCIGVFMNVFDVHVNRAPVTAKLSRVAYKPGAFFSADLDKASEQNERNGFVFDTEHGPLAAVQIAGLVARRILSWKKTGDSADVGERIGLIRFGSRVDVYLPAGTTPVVAVGQRTLAGETILARFGQAVAPTEFREA